MISLRDYPAMREEKWQAQMKKSVASSEIASDAQLVRPIDLDARLPGTCVGTFDVVDATVDGDFELEEEPVVVVDEPPLPPLLPVEVVWGVPLLALGFVVGLVLAVELPGALSVAGLSVEFSVSVAPSDEVSLARGGDVFVVAAGGGGELVVMGLGFVCVFGDACVVDCTGGGEFCCDCGAELCWTGCGWASIAWQKLMNCANLGSRYALVVIFVCPMFAAMQLLQSVYEMLNGEPATQRAGDLPTACASR
jgi:hypothetical protein